MGTRKTPTASCEEASERPAAILIRLDVDFIMCAATAPRRSHLRFVPPPSLCPTSWLYSSRFTTLQKVGPHHPPLPLKSCSTGPWVYRQTLAAG